MMLSRVPSKLFKINISNLCKCNESCMSLVRETSTKDVIELTELEKITQQQNNSSIRRGNRKLDLPGMFNGIMAAKVHEKRHNGSRKFIMKDLEKAIKFDLDRFDDSNATTLISDFPYFAAISNDDPERVKEIVETTQLLGTHFPKMVITGRDVKLAPHELKSRIVQLRELGVSDPSAIFVASHLFKFNETELKLNKYLPMGASLLANLLNYIEDKELRLKIKKTLTSSTTNGRNSCKLSSQVIKDRIMHEYIIEKTELSEDNLITFKETKATNYVNTHYSMENAIKIVDIITSDELCKPYFKTIDWYLLFMKLTAEDMKDILEREYMYGKHVSQYWKYNVVTCFSSRYGGLKAIDAKIEYLKSKGFTDTQIEKVFAQIMAYSMQHIRERVEFWFKAVDSSTILGSENSLRLVTNYHRAFYNLSNLSAKKNSVKLTSLKPLLVRVDASCGKKH